MDFTRLSLLSQGCHCFHNIVMNFTRLSLVSQHCLCIVFDFTTCHGFHKIGIAFARLSQHCHEFHKVVTGFTTLSLISQHVIDFTRLSLLHNIVFDFTIYKVVIDFTRLSLVSQHSLGFHYVVMDFTMLSQTRTQVQRCRNTDIARNEQVKHVEGQKKVAEKVEPKMLDAKTLQNQTPKTYDFSGHGIAVSLAKRCEKHFCF